MTSTPTPEPAKITCPDCGGHPSEPKLRTEGGSLSCSFCNRTLTFNFMRDNEPEHRACACRASRNARCQTCGGDGEIDVRPAPSTPGEGTGRPGGWVEGIGWVALFHDLPEGTRFLSHSASEPPITSIVGVMCSPDDWENYPVIVTRWADGTTPAPPASPVPPTPTPCPYIVTGGEGTSHCSLAERSAMHAAAPPSTPADPRPTDLTGSEA